ncbi:hypothetical protein VTK73DRAFT_3798 [Phialemonium thermophilum]|uniref:Sulfatase N-terminal domain-containing protein n=1 Tax=Phialemonium thermophilum TaxID=223376 RepID=A0ABR3VEP7_9PEZI
MAPSRPNILFVMADDHAAKAISCYGAGINYTPHLDRLAAEGMRFDHCYQDGQPHPQRRQASALRRLPDGHDR